MNRRSFLGIICAAFFGLRHKLCNASTFPFRKPKEKNTVGETYTLDAVDLPKGMQRTCRMEIQSLTDVEGNITIAYESKGTICAPSEDNHPDGLNLRPYILHPPGTQKDFSTTYDMNHKTLHWYIISVETNKTSLEGHYERWYWPQLLK